VEHASLSPRPTVDSDANLQPHSAALIETPRASDGEICSPMQTDGVL